ncbi:DUF503 domain-containing protein [Erysipelothrix urinaevulpis]|uniref:DUF503 domain-containing protein n=1 Tax=Erysipelothrix urinaevulpis TaxID=2683717 RepID=UPI001F3DF670|nr:DUF503 domain-containing protein [Erysipelothrix urinaevulpis]
MCAVEVSLSLRDSQVHSLKDKRRIVSAILAKTSQKFNVSISEIAEHDNLNELILGIVNVSSSKRQSEQIIQRCLNFIEHQFNYDIIDVYYDI